MALYSGMYLALLCTLAATTAAQVDMKDRCHWKCLIFAQLWPGSYCMTFTKFPCRIPAQVDGWTIHGLWKSEWYKHGTCGTCADSMSCPDKYFSRALELRTKFSIDKSLAAAGIKPSCDYSYTYEHIQSALGYLGTHVNLQCYIHKKQQILMQIKIPLSKDLSAGCHTDEENVSKSYNKPCTKKSEIYLYPFTTHPHNPCS
ncbi:hypothetical protein scyTo_0009448 [Scyliorhinus torazame]|uniref:Uncharacterized protein n=1 Tax=Scyliorhinus torazame TaxID=75743 RepID=A0A401NME3_SCYTO|nr:hypothetical protein [Scyliorhinus torazame]